MTDSFLIYFSSAKRDEVGVLGHLSLHVIHWRKFYHDFRNAFYGGLTKEDRSKIDPVGVVLEDMLDTETKLFLYLRDALQREVNHYGKISRGIAFSTRLGEEEEEEEEEESGDRAGEEEETNADEEEPLTSNRCESAAAAKKHCDEPFNGVMSKMQKVLASSLDGKAMVPTTINGKRNRTQAARNKSYDEAANGPQLLKKTTANSNKSNKKKGSSSASAASDSGSESVELAVEMAIQRDAKGKAATAATAANKNQVTEMKKQQKALEKQLKDAEKEKAAEIAQMRAALEKEKARADNAECKAKANEEEADRLYNEFKECDELLKKTNQALRKQNDADRQAISAAAGAAKNQKKAAPNSNKKRDRAAAASSSSDSRGGTEEGECQADESGEDDPATMSDAEVLAAMRAELVKKKSAIPPVHHVPLLPGLPAAGLLAAHGPHHLHEAGLLQQLPAAGVQHHYLQHHQQQQYVQQFQPGGGGYIVSGAAAMPPMLLQQPPLIMGPRRGGLTAQQFMGMAMYLGIAPE